MFGVSTKFDHRNAMDYWAKYICSWGIFSAEVFVVEAYFLVLYLKLRHIFGRSLSTQLNCNSKNAHFLLSGHVNSKNDIFWGSTPPEHCLQRSLHSVKCTAWVAISKHGIIGPFWFEDANERSVTINTEWYVQVLGKFCTALGRRRGVLKWFQQDSATPQTANESLAWLQQCFPDRLISRKCDPQWSPHSPDLNSSDFYMWGYLKGRVYGNNPQTIPDLKVEISSNKSDPNNSSVGYRMRKGVGQGWPTYLRLGSTRKFLANSRSTSR